MYGVSHERGSGGKVRLTENFLSRIRQMLKDFTMCYEVNSRVSLVLQGGTGLVRTKRLRPGSICGFFGWLLSSSDLTLWSTEGLRHRKLDSVFSSFSTSLRLLTTQSPVTYMVSEHYLLRVLVVSLVFFPGQRPSTSLPHSTLTSPFPSVWCYSPSKILVTLC